MEIWTGVTDPWPTHPLTALKDRATQLLIKYKSGALVTQFIIRERENADQAGSIMMMAMMVLVELMILKMMKRKNLFGDFPNEKKLTRPWFLLPSLCCSNWGTLGAEPADDLINCKLANGHPQQEEANFFPISKDNLKIEVTNDLIYSVLVVLDSLKKYLFS